MTEQAGFVETDYVEVFPDKGQYVLRDRTGRCPSAGDRVEGEGGVDYVVLKVGRSPLPNDRRRCVYLELSHGVNQADEPPLQR